MFSIPKMFQACYENKDLISQCLSNTKENYQSFTAIPLPYSSFTTPPPGLTPNVPVAPPTPAEQKKVLGMAVELFIVIMILFIVLWISSLVLLLVYWNQITNPIRIISILMLCGILGPISPIISIVLILTTRK